MLTLLPQLRGICGTEDFRIKCLAGTQEAGISIMEASRSTWCCSSLSALLEDASCGKAGRACFALKILCGIDSAPLIHQHGSCVDSLFLTSPCTQACREITQGEKLVQIDQFIIFFILFLLYMICIM